MELNQHLSHMVPRKSAIFIGRDHPDTGLSEYKILAKRFNLKLDIHTRTLNAMWLLPGFDFAFVSRYLAILEALSVGIPVLAHYNTTIKYDYLTLSPFIKYIKIFQDPSDPHLNLNFDKNLIKQGQKWARTQTWQKVADLYEELWSK